MIDVKEAAQTAVKYVKEVLGTDIMDPRIEEVELSNDEAFWNITVGFLRPLALPGGLISQIAKPEREFKQVRIQAADGTVRAMKIRVP